MEENEKKQIEGQILDLRSKITALKEKLDFLLVQLRELEEVINENL